MFLVLEPGRTRRSFVGAVVAGTAAVVIAGWSAGAAADTDTSISPVVRGGALLVTGTIPLVGTDVQFKAALEAAGLDVEVIQERTATPAHANGKRLVLLSYGMKSTAFDAEAFIEVPVPIILTEHYLLPRLGMSQAHGYTEKMTTLTFASNHALARGLAGDVDVYATSQEFFWGTPSPAAIRIAHVVGQPDHVTFFAYEKGARMDGAVARAKRVQFFHASHSPDPIDANLYLNATGLTLLDATIAWCLK
jgi:hypothetical protein